MTRLSHPLLAFALALMLTLTGQSMAVARGASAATDQMVLCIGTASVKVYIDAEGKPTAAPHICPDCAFAGMSAMAADVPGTDHREPLCQATKPVPRALIWTAWQETSHRSRAPPF